MRKRNKAKKRPHRKAYSPFKLSKSSVETITNLFEAASPKELRENLLEIYHIYLIHTHNVLPLDFTKMSSNMYLLIWSLEKIDAREC